MKRLCLLLLVLGLCAAPSVSAAGDTTPIDAARLHLHFVIPNNLPAVPSDPYTSANCVAFTGGNYETFVQACRYPNATFYTDVARTMADDQAAILGTRFYRTGQEYERESAYRVNGIDGELSLFFYENPASGVERANYLFVGVAGDDIVGFLTQTDLFNPNGADMFTESLNSFDAFSP
jgi:hypothetical protein